MNLLRAASTVSLFTLASRVTGLARELIVAATFGASAVTDAFNVAFRIPNLLRRLFAEGAFSQAFVPILGEARGKEGDAATRLLIDAVATVLFWAVLATSLVGIVGAPVVVWMMAAGLADFDAAVVMTRLMFPYIACMSLAALSAGILNTWKRFALPAATPVLLNLSVIGAAWLLTPRFRDWGIEPVYALAVGVLIGGLLQSAVQVPALRRIGMMPSFGVTPSRLRAAWRHAGVQRVLAKMLPATVGVSVAQLSLLINTQIASHVGVGAVSWLTYADRLMEFPTALLGVALGVVLLPQLTAARAVQEDHTYSALLDWGLRLVLVLTLPCAAALLVFARPMVAALYNYGAFTARDVGQTELALMGYGVGLLGLVAVKVLAPGFYARQDMKTPVLIAIAMLTATQLMNIALVPRLGHAGLALSIGIAALFNALALLVGLVRRGIYVAQAGWAGFAGRVVVATAALGGGLAWAAHAVDWIALGAQPGLRVALLAGALGGAALVYFAALALLGVSLRQFVRRS